MSRAAVLTLVVAAVLIWGGLVASVTWAVIASRRVAREARERPGDQAPPPPG